MSSQPSKHWKLLHCIIVYIEFLRNSIPLQVLGSMLPGFSSRGSTPDFLEEGARRYETCIRCQRDIYPTEKADVGVALHKNCFRCVACNVTLTLGGAIIARPDDRSRPAVYCKSHAPKPIKCALDEQAMEIQSAVKAQKISDKINFNKQVILFFPYLQ